MYSILGDVVAPGIISVKGVVYMLRKPRELRKLSEEELKGINNSVDAVKNSDWYEKLASFQERYMP